MPYLLSMTLPSVLLGVVLSSPFAAGQTVEMPRLVKQRFELAEKYREEYQAIKPKKGNLASSIAAGDSVGRLLNEWQFLPQTEFTAEIDKYLKNMPASELNTLYLNGGFYPGSVEQRDLATHGVEVANITADFDFNIYQKSLELYFAHLYKASSEEIASRKKELTATLSSLRDAAVEKKRRLLLGDLDSQATEHSRRLYRKYVQATTRSNLHVHYARMLVHRDILDAEENCNDPTDVTLFNESVMNHFLAKAKQFANFSPATPDDFQKLLFERNECLVRIDYLKANIEAAQHDVDKIGTSQVQLSNLQSRLEHKLVSGLRTPADAASLLEDLKKQMPEWMRQGQKLNEFAVLQPWQAMRLDAYSDWNSSFFNAKAVYEGQVIVVETIPPDSSFAGVKMVPGRRRGPGRGGRSGDATGEVTAIRWKVACADSHFVVTLATPVCLNSNAINLEPDLLDMQYANHKNQVQTLNTRLADSPPSETGLVSFTGAGYRPSYLEQESFVPTYATVPIGKHRVGFVITQVSPGAGDLDVGAVLRSILTR